MSSCCSRRYYTIFLRGARLSSRETCTDRRRPGVAWRTSALLGVLCKNTPSNRWHAEVEELKSASRDSSSGNQTQSCQTKSIASPRHMHNAILIARREVGHPAGHSGMRVGRLSRRTVGRASLSFHRNALIDTIRNSRPCLPSVYNAARCLCDYKCHQQIESDVSTSH